MLITTQYYYGIIKDLNVYILTMNMEIIGPLLLSIISGMSTLLGSLIIFFKIKKVGEFITFSLSLSMIIMIIISIPLYYSGKSRGVVVGYTILASISEPLGALLSYIILKSIINQLILSYVLMFVSGLMISLSINDILKEILSYNKYKYMIIGIITGILLSVIILWIWNWNRD